MSASCGSCCSSQSDKPVVDKVYRRVLWFALIANFGMFFVEIVAGAMGRSLALTADAVDFFSDGANYAITLVVLGMSLSVRSKAALFKGLCMGMVGLYVLLVSVSHIVEGTVPRAEVMGVVGTMALMTNVVVALMLFRFRGGDANRQSIWICSRNDAIANIAVLMAGLGVWSTTTGWPDIIVGLGIAALGLQGAFQIIRKSLLEMRLDKLETIQ